MKEINIYVNNQYSCQSCSKVFERDEEIKIEITIWPVCCSRCEFRVIYSFIKKCKFSDEILLKMHEIALNNRKIDTFSRNQAIFDITKYYVKKGLSNIKLIFDIRQRQKNLDKECDSLTVRQQNPPYVIGGLSNNLSNNLGVVKVQSCQSNGGLEKWF